MQKRKPLPKKQQYQLKATDKRSAFLGVVVVLAILVTGTFAFNFARQAAFNPGRVNQLDLTGGRVHDDFENREGPGNLNKDVFAENFGVTDLAVRIRFREFAEINGVAIGGTSYGPAVINNPLTWPIYLAELDDAHMRRAGTYSAQIGNIGIGWTLGNAENVNKIFMPTFNHVSRPAPFDPAVTILPPFNDPEMFRFSNTTGRGVEAIAGFNVGAATSVDDFINNGLQTGATISDGTHNFWSVGQMYTSTLHFIDYAMTTPSISATAATHIAQRTMPAEEGGIMTIQQWIDADYPSGNFWIMDVDGWFYWNGYMPGTETRRDEARAMRESLGLNPADPLPEQHAWLDLPTVATSLLLDQIFIPNQTGLEYIIFIQSDFFTSDGLIEDNTELPDISDEARLIFLPELFRIGVGVYSPVTLTAIGQNGIVPGPGIQTVASFERVIRRYRGDVYLETVPMQPGYQVELIGDGPSVLTTTISVPPIGSDEPAIVTLNLTVPATEMRETLIIRITEPRSRNHIEIPITVLHD